MKKLININLIGFILILLTLSINAQINKSVKPISFSESFISLDKVPVIIMPEFNLAEMIKEDSIIKLSGIKVLRYAKSIEVNIDLKKQGLKEFTSDGGKLYRLGIKSIGAYSLNLAFNNYELPPKAELFTYSADKKNIIGPFTNKHNQENRNLATSPVKGDKIYIELYEPENAEFEAHANIGWVNHDYKNILEILKDTIGQCCGYRKSENCEIDINCPDGNNWQNEKQAVCRILTTSCLCTGSLINNINNNGTPYLLTANHCYNEAPCIGGSPGTTVFYFNYESPTCSGADGINIDTINGAIYRASWANSDFYLMELHTQTPFTYNAYYNGWNRNNTAASNEVGIHHPMGDVKKISTSSNGLTSTAFNSNTSDTSANHWRIVWNNNPNQGVTEEGSSGSPLYNQNHRVVGQLHGGYSDCSAQTQPDWYGKIFSSWTGGGTDASGLRHWLDPNNTVTDLPGLRFIQNQTYSANATITGDNVRLVNVTIQNNANIVVDINNNLMIDGPFNAALGTTLDFH